ENRAMKEEKRNRITAAITVNAVLLVFILVAVIIAQIVQISILSRRKQDLQVAYAELLVEKDKAESVEEQLEVDEKFKNWLLEYINVYGDEDPLNVLPDGISLK
ncbi:MAG: hypothetical protein ACI4MC_00335, partial [Candidatus Coproplasma sp.]